MQAEGTADEFPNSRITMLLCFLVAVLEGYDLQVISSAGPALQKAMQLSPEQIGVLFSSSLVGLGVGAVLGGFLADRFGRKPVLAWSVFALGLFTALTALATSYEMVLLMRVLAGIGLGGAMPTMISLIAEVAGGRRTTSAVTTMICGQPLGGILSGMVGRTVAMEHGWQSLFVIGGILTMIIVPLLWRVLSETAQKAGHEVPKMTTGQALFGESRATSTILLWIVFILTLALLSILLSWTPMLVMGKGLSKPVGINAIIALNVGGIIGGLLISRLVDRHGAKWPMLGLYATTAVGLYLLSQSSSASAVLAAAALLGIGVLGAQFTLYGIAPRLYPFAGRGSGVGWAVAMGRLGSVLGPIVIGALIGRGSSENTALISMVTVAIAAGIALYLLANSRHEALAV
jgi:MFS transporter, AAHS family, 3-hydroxyphenylpropionic acid transporter